MLTIKQIAERSGMPEWAIRDACHRSPGYHPLPHVKSGKVRPVIRIRWEAFEKWLQEEEKRNG